MSLSLRYLLLINLHCSRICLAEKNYITMTITRVRKSSPSMSHVSTKWAKSSPMCVKISSLWESCQKWQAWPGRALDKISSEITAKWQNYAINQWVIWGILWRKKGIFLKKIIFKFIKNLLIVKLLTVKSWMLIHKLFPDRWLEGIVTVGGDCSVPKLGMISDKADQTHLKRMSRIWLAVESQRFHAHTK